MSEADALYERDQYWKDILRERDLWIVELNREKEAAVGLLRRAVKEAIPDAMIFAAHTDSNRYRKALEDLRQWTAEAKAILDEEDRRNGHPPDTEKAPPA